MKKGFLGFDDMKFDIVYKVSDAEIQTLCKKPLLSKILKDANTFKIKFSLKPARWQSGLVMMKPALMKIIFSAI